MITETEYNVINQYRELINNYRYNGELRISYDIKQVLKPIYYTHSKTILNMGCDNCVKNMINYMIQLLDQYETSLTKETKPKRKRIGEQ